MGALVPFAYGDALVRLVEVDDAPWWVAGDVAKVLGYSRARDMLRKLDDDEQGAHIVRGFEGDRMVAREVPIISESGLYHAILKSRRPGAKVFRKWVTSEVLPAIRRNGFYQARSRELGAAYVDRIKSLRGREPSEKEAMVRDLKLDVLAFVTARVEAGQLKTDAIADAAEAFGRCRATIYNYFREARMVPEEDLAVALTPDLRRGGGAVQMERLS